MGSREQPAAPTGRSMEAACRRRLVTPRGPAFPPRLPQTSRARGVAGAGATESDAMLAAGAALLLRREQRQSRGAGRVLAAAVRKHEDRPDPSWRFTMLPFLD